ncbi:MAG: nitroreductase/SAM-dependent methyltransferase [Planctomycetota bacterium]|jgi:nitroreductase/SAM-dependent methyltransferase
MSPEDPAQESAPAPVSKAPPGPKAPELSKSLPVQARELPGLEDLLDGADASFWSELYGRRSVRKFLPDPVPRELADRVIHAGTWAPSSCNYQMWDLVAVDDPEINHALASLSTQMGNAPLNVIVSYGRAFSEEGYANIQSASAMIQNMSLAAHALGLGTFWITQMGGAEKVRELVGLPVDRFVVAVLAVGYPAKAKQNAPKRRPLADIRHWNHYGGRPIPSSAQPEHWAPDLLAIYQRARVLNGLRHNKPRPWEVRAIEQVVESFVPKAPEEAASAPRWLDVLPCTGIITDRLSKRRRGYQFDVVERSRGVAEFAGNRTRPKAGKLSWPSAADLKKLPSLADVEAPVEHIDADSAEGQLDAPNAGTYDVITCIFRLEGVAPVDRASLVAAMAAWLAPGGSLILGVVNKRSFHDWTERLRARRGGPRGVEYVLSPDPNIGPFGAVDCEQVRALVLAQGLTCAESLGLQAVPQPEEIEFRTRNFSARMQGIARTVGKALGMIEKLPGLQSRRGRFRFYRFTKPGA